MNWNRRNHWTRVCVFAAVVTLAGPAASAQRRASGGDWCGDEHWGDDRQGFCEVRDYTVPAAGATLTVDATPNGGISADGEPRNDISISARVSATADTAEEARAIVSRIQVTATADRVEATGPRGMGRHEGWSVSYRLKVPPQTPLTLRSTNGGIVIDNVNSRLDLQTTNGGLKLSRVGGDVEGRTTNGGIDATLEGSGWQGNGLDLQTTNGGVHLTLPDNYNAHLETSTTNGRVSIDFPVTVQGTLGRSVSTDLGNGGATIRLQTSNGGVKITRR
jgi:Putative adhesin